MNNWSNFQVRRRHLRLPVLRRHHQQPSGGYHEQEDQGVLRLPRPLPHHLRVGPRGSHGHLLLPLEAVAGKHPKPDVEEEEQEEDGEGEQRREPSLRRLRTRLKL